MHFFKKPKWEISYLKKPVLSDPPLILNLTYVILEKQV